MQQPNYLSFDGFTTNYNSIELESHQRIMDLYSVVHDTCDIQSLDHTKNIKPLSSQQPMGFSGFASDPQMELLNALLIREPNISHSEVDDHQTKSFTSSSLPCQPVTDWDQMMLVRHNHSQSQSLLEVLPPSYASSDSMLPVKRVLTQPSQNKRTKGDISKVQRCGEEGSHRQIHIQSERQRRKGMNHLFQKMKALLPSSAPKTDKSTVIAEVINHIKSLQHTLSEVKKKKSNKPSTSAIVHLKCETSSGLSGLNNNNKGANATWFPEECTTHEFSATLYFKGCDVFITVACQKEDNFLSALFFILEEHNLQLLTTNVSITDQLTYNCIHLKYLETPDMAMKQALKSALQKVISSNTKIFVE